KEINRLLALPRKQYAFIDVGCGKGLALLMAAAAGYLQVIGLEISPLLCGIANENIERFRQCRGIVYDIRVLNCDATQFDLPHLPCVLYFYNPFKLELMQQMV